MCHEQKEVRNGVGSEGRGLGSSEEDESRVDNATVNVNDGSGGATEVQNGLQVSHQQPQGPVIRWERFLPIGSLKVLLVENDESTRNLVSALLRNCSYEVTAVANGVQAWKVLEDLTNQIDLVLTEVVMPVLSGLGLLSKIMSHKSFKNIPVIMMSSHDSMGLVFQCLTKGAVDFLVKPIRKNELKNLWQHVWRRCHSSSGSGSESGTQSKRSTKSKCNNDSENNTGSSDEHDNGSDGLMICDGSDNGSGTQSSWTKRAAVERSQPTSSSNQLLDAPDSICAQLIHAKPETHVNLRVCISKPKQCQEEDELNDGAPIGKDLEIGFNRNPDLQAEHQCDNLSTHQANRRQNGLLEDDCKPLMESGQMDQKKENMTGKDVSPEIITGMANYMNHQAGARDLNSPTGPSDISYVKDKACLGSGDVPSLELTLKRPQGDGASRNAMSDDQNVLRHSDSSAFSKYHTASCANQAPTGNVGSNSPLDNSSVAMKTEAMQNFPSHSNGIFLNHQSNGSSNNNNNDMVSTAQYVTPKREAVREKFESLSAFKPFHSSAFQPAQNGHISSAQKALPEKVDHVVVNTVDAQLSGSNQLLTVQHGYYHHPVEKMQQHLQRQQQQQQSQTVTSLKGVAVTAMQCGSSNVFEGPTECNVVNYSVNGSASGSNHGSNGPNGSSIAPNAEQTNVESDNGAAGNSEAGAISGRIGASGLDENRAAQREAALTKFRQKRKERCFEKKVRYHSRKKLAEQRPRVKGQFVRRTASDSEGRQDCAGSNGDNSCDSSR